MGKGRRPEDLTPGCRSLQLLFSFCNIIHNAVYSRKYILCLVTYEYLTFRRIAFRQVSYRKDICRYFSGSVCIYSKHSSGLYIIPWSRQKEVNRSISRLLSGLETS